MTTKAAVNYSGFILLPHLIICAWQKLWPSSGSAGGAGTVWHRVADGSSTIYSSSRAAQGECCSKSLAGLFLAIRASGRQFQMRGKKRKRTRDLHSSEVTLERPKARLISIPVFSIQWKLFFPHNLCSVSTGCPKIVPNPACLQLCGLGPGWAGRIYCAVEVVLPWQLRHMEF